MPIDIIFSKTKLCGEERWNGGAALAIHSGTLRQSEHDPFWNSVAARGIAQRAGLVKIKALDVKTLRLQEVVRGEKITDQVDSLKANKAELGTKVLPVAKLNALRAACGIVVHGGMLNESGEDENDDG